MARYGLETIPMERKEPYLHSASLYQQAIKFRSYLSISSCSYNAWQFRWRPDKKDKCRVRITALVLAVSMIVMGYSIFSHLDTVELRKYWIINYLTTSKCLSDTTVYNRFACIIVINVGRQDESPNLLGMVIVAFLNYH
jgi:hypothetical protein